jgi:hypothetical protein
MVCVCLGTPMVQQPARPVQALAAPPGQVAAASRCRQLCRRKRWHSSRQATPLPWHWPGRALRTSRPTRRGPTGRLSSRRRRPRRCSSQRCTQLLQPGALAAQQPGPALVQQPALQPAARIAPQAQQLAQRRRSSGVERRRRFS